MDEDLDGRAARVGRLGERGERNTAARAPVCAERDAVIVRVVSGLGSPARCTPPPVAPAISPISAIGRLCSAEARAQRCSMRRLHRGGADPQGGARRWPEHLPCRAVCGGHVPAQTPPSRWYGRPRMDTRCRWRGTGEGTGAGRNHPSWTTAWTRPDGRKPTSGTRRRS